MNENIVVSICCQTYNHVNYIEKCLEGFLMQKTDFKFEVLLRDDASTDGTTQIVKKYSDKYPDIINPLIYNENQFQKGISPFRDNVKRAKSKYIAICEGDDYWTDPLKLQKQVDFLDGNPEYGLVYSDVDRYQESTNLLEKRIFKNILGLKENTFEDFLINAWWLAPCTWMIRRDTLDQLPSYPSDFRVGDYPLLLSLARFSKIGFIPESTAVYRVLEKSASRNNSSLRFDYFFRKGIFDIQLYFCKRYDVSALVLDKVYSNYYQHNINDGILLRDKPMYSVARNYLQSRGMLNWKNRLLLCVAELPLVLGMLAKIF
jgi:glycosyltransferase involved in cell wall biosynthesis